MFVSGIKIVKNRFGECRPLANTQGGFFYCVVGEAGEDMETKEDMAKQSKMTKGKITIDVRDWQKEFAEIEPDLTGDDPIIDLALTGLKPQQAGRMITIAGERGDLKDFPGSKLLLMVGGANFFSSHVARAKREITLKNGKTFSGRAYIAPAREVAGEDEEDQSDNDTHLQHAASSLPASNWLDEKVVSTIDPATFDRAVRYLFNQVTGNIWKRFLHIAEHKPGEVERIAGELKDRIDEMVERLS